MKVLLAIPHYGSNNRQHLLTCLREYNSYKECEITVHIYATEEFDVSEFKNLNIFFAIFPKDIGQMLVHQHKPWFVELRNQFDYFFYCEDDILVPYVVFQTYLKIQKTLPSPYACGFLRYEHKPNNNYKFLFDQHPVHSVHRGGTTIIKSNYIINGEDYFEVYNIHQGCYLLTQELLNLAINKNTYLDQSGYYAGHPLEGAASDVYFKCGITKVIPRSEVSNLIVRHLPDKYVNMLPDIYTELTTPDDVTISTTQKDLNPVYV
jgi:hypothetical protein